MTTESIQAHCNTPAVAGVASDLARAAAALSAGWRAARDWRRLSVSGIDREHLVREVYEHNFA